LRVGELIYKPDIGLNVVLAMEYGGREIQPGDSVYKGSEIDIILGDGLASTRVQIPDLRSFSLTEARFILHEYGLNLGAVNYHEETEDSTKAIIYDQVPLPREGADIAHGEAISIFLAEPKVIDSHNLIKPSNSEDFDYDNNNGFPDDEF
jgi:eukaryotic-like serine/threonine-protein kinase